jgi:integrase
MATTKVTVRPVMVRGVQQWRVRFWENGKPKRHFHDSKTAAETEAKTLREQANQSGAVWQSLSAFERNELIAAYSKARELGVDIHKAILTASQNGSGLASLGIGKVIAELKASLLRNGRNEDYVTNAAVVWNQFARGRESIDVNRLTFKDVEAFIDSKNLEYRQTVRGRLSSLFNYAVRRGYRIDNPCDRLETVKVTRPQPATFTSDQVKAAVKWLNKNAKHGLPWFGLSAFCGLRPEEAEKTTKSDIHFKEGFIRVEAQTTKVRQRRVVYPKPEAMAFLKWALKRGSLPLGSDRKRYLISGREGKSVGLRGALGFDVWPKDITRHTAASYWLAGEGETVKHVAKMLGHSESTCESRYKAVKTQKESENFWQAVKNCWK